MSRTARLTVALVVVVLVAGAAFAYLQFFRSTEQTVEATVLPQIAQPGADPASERRGAGAVAGHRRPRPRRAARSCSRRSSTAAGRRWPPPSRTPTAGSSSCCQRAASHGGRVVPRHSPGGDGLEEATSDELAGDLWGEPDFDDEFDGDAMSADWLNRGEDYNPEGLRACSKGSGEAVEVEGGTLGLSVLLDRGRAPTRSATAKNANGKAIGNFDYRLNGHVMTNGHYFRYGVLAARIKFQERQGQHALAVDAAGDLREHHRLGQGRRPRSTSSSGSARASRTAGWPASSTCSPRTARRRSAAWLEDPDQYLAGQDDSWFEDYHVFSVEWTPEEYIFRIDGQETWRTSEGISHQPEYPILSLLSSDYELENLGKTSNLPQTMQVDWLKFWEA